MKRRKRLFTFDTLPSIKKRRSYFPLSYGHTTSLSAGRLQPCYIQEVYPGDTFKMKANVVAQVSSAFLKPVMDNAFIELNFFFIPHRLAFENFAEIFGENNDSAWARQTPVEMPVVPAGSGSKSMSGTLSDYLGVPLTSYAYKETDSLISVVDNYVTFEPQIIPFRDVAIVWNDWYRNENVNQPMHIQKGVFVASEKLDDADWAPNHYTGKCPPVNKSKDYFTTALPAPQKGESIPLVAGSIEPRILPVSALRYGGTVGMPSKFPSTADTLEILRSQYPDDVFLSPSSLGGDLNPTFFSNVHGALFGGINGAFQAQPYVVAKYSTNFNGVGQVNGGGVSLSSNNNVEMSNLGAYDDGSGLSLTPMNVNDFRYAMALQTVLERAGRMGTRYVEYLLSAFGVVSSDARLQRSEFLGGAKFPISIQQVAQTSQPTSQSPLGALGAYSLSNGSARYNKGFVEHGYIIGFISLKQFHTYQQGLERFWKRRSQFDFYDPYLSNIGEQPIWQDELFTNGTPTDTEPTTERQVFGYSEAWNDLRFRRNHVTGNVRFNSTKYVNGAPSLSNSLGVWKFADVYANAPSLNDDFLEETPDFIDKTLSVESESQDQFLVDIWFEQSAYRCMPVYSTPARLR